MAEIEIISVTRDKSHPAIKCYTAEVKEDFKGHARELKFASVHDALIDGRYLLVGNSGDKYCGDYPEYKSQGYYALFDILPYNLPFPESKEDTRWIVFGPAMIDVPPGLKSQTVGAKPEHCGQDMGHDRWLDLCLTSGDAIQWIKFREFLRKAPD